ncbi:MAG: NAD(P)H-hydrate dehydratase [Bacillota bacterium]
MVRLYTAAEMKRADELATASGIPSLVLMENAGRAVARVALDLVEPEARARGSVPGLVVVLAGRGNNGGDGLVAARHLAERGLPVEVVLAEAAETLAGDARTNLEALTRGGFARPRVFGEAGLGPSEFAPLLARAAVVVDALLGTGARGRPREPVADLIALVNSVSGPRVLAVDLPSGLDADTGRARGEAVRAAATVTFGGVKAGLAAPEAREHTGRLYLAPIGLPSRCLEEASADSGARPRRGALRWLLPPEAAVWLPPRPVTGHKGTFGRVFVLAGSPGFTGAAVLAALGALRAGAGLVTALCPEGSRPLVAGALPEALTRGLPEDTSGRLSADAAGELDTTLGAALGGAAGRTALVAGPGLGVGDGVAAVVGRLVGRLSLPVVLDADALNNLALAGPEAVADALSSTRRPDALVPVLTPHPGEMARLTGRPAEDIQADRTAAALAAATAWRCVVVLKGAGTVVAAPDGRAWLNATGNPGLATAGSGDVLAGAIGAYLAQGVPPLEAALLGVAVHGLAGDLAAAEVGSRGLLASDVAHRLPRAAESLAGATGYGPILVDA